MLMSGGLSLNLVYRMAASCSMRDSSAAVVKASSGRIAVVYLVLKTVVVVVLWFMNVCKR